MVKDALKVPKIAFTPKQKIRDAANSVDIDKGTATTSYSGGSSESNDVSFD